MKAAIVTGEGKTPIYGEFPEPTPKEGEVKVSVTCAALSNIVRSRASGVHYSSSGQFPFIVGVDGVGRLENGSRMYFALPRAPYGTMSERTVVRSALCAPVPDDLDDVTAAAIANPGQSSWAALKERAKFVAGEVVLVNGATGMAGKLAVQVAKHLGARKVVATGRNVEALKAVAKLGADVTIPLGDAGDPFEEAVKNQFVSDGIDVVVDYLWGPSAERIIIAAAKAGRDAVPLRFVHVGSVSAPNITLPSAALRASAITIMGSGIGSVPFDRLAKVIGEVLQATKRAGFEIATQTASLADIEKVWPTAPSEPRLVIQVS